MFNYSSQFTTKEKILYMVMEKGDTDLSKLIRNTKNMSVHMIIYYWSEMLNIVNEIHTKGKNISIYNYRLGFRLMGVIFYWKLVHNPLSIEL